MTISVTQFPLNQSEIAAVGWVDAAAAQAGVTSDAGQRDEPPVLGLGPPPVTAAFVKAGGSVAGTSTGVSSLSVTVPAGGHAVGNTLVVAALCGQTNIAAPSSVTDSKGNTYTIDNSLVGSVGTAIASSKLTTALVAGDTVTVHWAAAQSLGAVATAEFSNVGAVDKKASNAGTAANPFDSGTTAALSQANEVAFGVFGCVGAVGAATPASGWTTLNDISIGSGTTRGLVWQYQIINSTAPVDSQTTVTTVHSYDGITTTYLAA